MPQALPLFSHTFLLLLLAQGVKESTAHGEVPDAAFLRSRDIHLTYQTRPKRKKHIVRALTDRNSIENLATQSCPVDSGLTCTRAPESAG